MTDISTKMMVEVLKIFEIATKELRRGSASDFPICCSIIFTKLHIEKFMKKLAGMTDLEDAVKKLDNLTQEEARMALAEVLRIAHNVRDEVKVVDSKVMSVDEKVQVVIDGARGLPNQPPITSDIYTFRRKRSQSVGKGSKINHTTDCE